MMIDVNALARKVQDAWDEQFTRPTDSSFDYRMARIAVETVRGAEPDRSVTFDLSGPDALFVLTEALGRFETYQADLARDDNAEERTRWAELAGKMREQAEAAFSGGTEATDG